MAEKQVQKNRTDLEERRFEIENRIKNLFWTISGDYSLDLSANLDVYARSQDLALYDAMKQGAFARYFDAQKLSLYLLKRIQDGAEEHTLMELAQICVDTAIYPWLCEERMGSGTIRKSAFEDLWRLEKEEEKETFFDQVKFALVLDVIGEKGQREILNEVPKLSWTIEKLGELSGKCDTDQLIRVIDAIYCSIGETEKGQNRKSLEEVLNLPLMRIGNDVELECLSDEKMSEILSKYVENMKKDMLRLKHKKSVKEKMKYVPSGETGDQEPEPSPEEIEKIHRYIELTYGRSYLSELEVEKLRRCVCRGIHRNCSLHFTNGILEDPVVKNNQYRFSQLQFEKNRLYYYNKHWAIKRNIEVLADILKKSLILKSDDEKCRATNGLLVPSRLWKLKRTEDDKIFDKVKKADSSEFVVDILLDSSGSQSKRQSQVAAQGYIVSEALSRNGIPHRVMSYCSFWDHTIFQRFRDYDDGKEKNIRIFEYRATGDNRDGLVIKAACESLYQRPEKHKILIILSDGKPLDMAVKRPGTRKTVPYFGKEAVKDTAMEVRRARNLGVAVLGIFAGDEEELSMEKMIFGKDFAYIRKISSFSRLVGAYLRGEIDRL